MTLPQEPYYFPSSFNGQGMSAADLQALAVRCVEELIAAGAVIRGAEGLKWMEVFAQTARSLPQFIECVQEEVIRCHGKIRTSSGTLIELCEAGIKYDYASDSEWCGLEVQIRALTDRQKQREALLRSIPEGRQRVNEQTGEVLMGAPKTSRSTYKITLAP